MEMTKVPASKAKRVFIIKADKTTTFKRSLNSKFWQRLYSILRVAQLLISPFAKEISLCMCTEEFLAQLHYKRD